MHAERASGSAVGEYLTKAAGLGSELVRSDIKRGLWVVVAFRAACWGCWWGRSLLRFVA